MTPLNTIKELSEIKGLIGSVRTLAVESSDSADLLDVIEDKMDSFIYEVTNDQCCPHHFIAGGVCSFSDDTEF